jgi:hypothetical protein
MCWVSGESFAAMYYAAEIKCADAAGTLRDTEFFVQVTA